MELQEAFDAGFEAVKKYVDDGFSSFEDRLKAVEARALLKGDAGISVKSAMQNSAGHLIITLGDGSQHDAGLVAAEPGKDGKDADPVLIKSLVAEAVAALPPAEPGKDGKDADPVLIKSLVAEAVAALPPAEPGKDGKDGLDVKDLLTVENGNLIATFSDGRTKDLGPFRGKDGRDVDMEVVKAAIQDAVKAIPAPKDGEDGFGFDDMELCETEAGFVIRFAKGDRIKDYRLPIVRDCGVYQLGRVYNKGDGISFGGSFWIAQKDGVTEKPEGGDGWRLAVKRGRDRTDPVKA